MKLNHKNLWRKTCLILAIQVFDADKLVEKVAKMKKLNWIALIAAASLFVAPTYSAWAAPELVVNGGFEDPTAFNGWTQHFKSHTFLECTDMEAPHSGICGAYFGGLAAQAAVSGLDYISQDITTSPGAIYHITLFIKNLNSNTNNELLVDWGSNTLLDLNNSPMFITYAQFSFDSPADASGMMTLKISGRNEDGNFYVDDVSVTRVEAVPEPTSLALLGLGLAGFGWARRRTKNA